MDSSRVSFHFQRVHFVCVLGGGANVYKIYMCICVCVCKMHSTCTFHIYTVSCIFIVHEKKNLLSTCTCSWDSKPVIFDLYLNDFTTCACAIELLELLGIRAESSGTTL